MENWRHRQFFLVVVLLLFKSLCLNSQGFRVRHYLPGKLNNSSRAIFETAPGVHIAAGIVVDSLNGSLFNRLCILGLNAQGQKTWIKEYGNPSFEYLENTLIARSFYKQGNNIYYAACVKENFTKYVGVLVKFDLNGDTIWQKIYRDSLEDVAPQMVTKSVDGGFLITGYFQNWNNNTQPCLLIKTDVNGNELWRKKLTKILPNVSDGKAIIQDSATKKIVIGGYQYIGNSSSWTDYDNILILDSLGVKLSQHTLAGSGNGGIIRDLIQTKDKKIVAVGWATYPQSLGGTNLISPYIIKFDLNNPSAPLWRINYFDGLRLMNVFSCIRELDNEDLIVGGTIDTLQMLNLPDNWLTRLVKIDKYGSIKSKRYYNYNTSPGNFNNQYLVSLDRASNNALVASLYSSNFPSPNPFIFVRYDSTGCDSSLAYCQSITSSTGTTGFYKEVYNNNSVQIFPNPVYDVLNVVINSVDQSEELEFVLQDLTGRDVKIFKLQQFNALSKVNISDLSSGSYLLFIRSGKRTIFNCKIVKSD